MKKNQPPYQYTSSIDDDAGTAAEIVSLLVSLFHPQSVVDFGCGLGNFVNAFREQGVTEVLGLDGDWARTDPRFHIREAKNFMVADLSQEVNLPHRYDLAICLEVAEHLPPSSSDTLVQSLVKASDIIIFSAAVPGQGGIHHVNEQWIGYWEKKFLQHGFLLHDVLRPVIWDNEKIKWWYRQNIFLFAHKDRKPEDQHARPAFNYLHPGLLENRNLEMNKLLEGKESLAFYIGLLWKKIKRKMKG
jgi:SAM-dependent methyltransferase